MTRCPWHRSENVAFDAVSCATVRVLSEGGPAKWLKNKNLQNHLCDYEPDSSLCRHVDYARASNKASPDGTTRRDYRSTSSSRIMSDAFSPIMTAAAPVQPLTGVGMIEMSATRRPCTPRTLNRSSTTAESA
jgi:hypothetical protein